ncbi:MAG: hypothetical protein CV087_23305 [Candidatus Brocadia sp. WS118]|nr:MAG: hypothetical protein CV087_23305 [Candidatus Brocadia sp. WS118]
MTTIDGAHKVQLTEAQKAKIGQLKQEVSSLSKYLTFKDGDKYVIQFDPERWSKQESEYEGRITERIVFEVYDVNTDTEKLFGLGNRKALDKIQKCFEQGFFTLRVKKIGEGKTTVWDIEPAGAVAD